MSVLGLMSRGYLCPVVPAQIVRGDPPSIVSSTVLEPEIQSASTGVQQPPPTIQAAESITPEIRGATTEDTVSPPDAPSITSGNLLVPTIVSAEED